MYLNFVIARIQLCLTVLVKLSKYEQYLGLNRAIYQLSRRLPVYAGIN